MSMFLEDDLDVSTVICLIIHLQITFDPRQRDHYWHWSNTNAIRTKQRFSWIQSCHLLSLDLVLFSKHPDMCIVDRSRNNSTYQVQLYMMFANSKLLDNCFLTVLGNEVFAQDSKYRDNWVKNWREQHLRSRSSRYYDRSQRPSG